MGGEPPKGQIRELETLELYAHPFDESSNGQRPYSEGYKQKLCFFIFVVATQFLFPIAILAQVTLGSRATIGGGVTIRGGANYAGSWSDFVRRNTLAVGIKQKDPFGKDRFVTGAADPGTTVSEQA